MRWWLPGVSIGLAACVSASGVDTASDHFDGKHFFNPEGESGTGGAQRHTLHGLYNELTGAGHNSWPQVAVTPTVPPARIDGAAMRVTWVGHSTSLVQTQGLNILLDPVWSERDSPVSFIGPKRVREPGVRIDDLPKIDLILLSHNHYDHLDMATMRLLWHRDRPLVVSALGNAAVLRDAGIASEVRDWGGRVAFRPGIEIIVERAHHWSERSPFDRDKALWCGFTVTLPGGNLYYAGDTGRGDMAWATAAAQHGPLRLAILPIGAFKPGLAESGNHIGPVEAVDAFSIIGAPYALGVHWGTFELTSEAIDDPPKLLAATLAERHIDPGRFRTLAAGEGWNIPAITSGQTASARAADRTGR